MKKLFKFIFFNLLILSASALTVVGIYQNKLADAYYVPENEGLTFNDIDFLECKPLRAELSVGRNNADSVSGKSSVISLFGIFPIKNVTVTNVKSADVAVLGSPFGIKLYTEGVLVVGFSDIETADGTFNPAKTAGILTGDTILKVNGKAVNSNMEMQRLINDSNGKKYILTVKRNGQILNISISPIKSQSDNTYKIGLWIRDSSAGIGTLTFYSPELDVLAGLGHGICDVDTGELVPFENGEMVGAEIVGIKKADKTASGEFKGVFAGDVLAEIKSNEITGVYGNNCKGIEKAKVMPVALKQEIKTGEAEILTTLDNGQPKTYKCRIEKVYQNDSSKIKNMIIRVTDSELLSKTGGIVQGMSGSPIIQNGRLVGAVTHVLVDDPEKGYGIFAENMLETARSVEQNINIKNAS